MLHRKDGGSMDIWISNNKNSMKNIVDASKAQSYKMSCTKNLYQNNMYNQILLTSDP